MEIEIGKDRRASGPTSPEDAARGREPSRAFQGQGDYPRRDATLGAGVEFFWVP
jgi:hypothetical protein